MEVISVEDFEQLVSLALEQLPKDLEQMLDNVVVLVEDEHPDKNHLGLYEGVPLPERGDYGGLPLPDRVTLYRFPLCQDAKDLD